MIALLSAFALCWTLAEFGIYYHMELGAVPESTRLVVYIVLAASYFWTSQVCRNVVVVTTSCVAAWAPCVYTCVRNPASLRPHLAVSSELYFVFALRERCLSHYLWPISETKNRSPIFLSSWCPLAMSQQQSP